MPRATSVKALQANRDAVNPVTSTDMLLAGILDANLLILSQLETLDLELGSLRSDVDGVTRAVEHLEEEILQRHEGPSL